MPKGHYKRKQRVERVTITCSVCGQSKEMLPSQLRKRTGKYCSKRCEGIANIKESSHITIHCSRCGKEFTKRTDHLKENNYCSKVCAAMARLIPSARWRDLSQIQNYNKEYYEKNKERIKENALRWARENPDNRTAIRQKRRAQAKAGDFTAQDWADVKREYGYACAYCHRTDKPLTLDHVIPLSKGGQHTKSNIVPACASCNSRKGNRLHAIYGIEIFETGG